VWGGQGTPGAGGNAALADGAMLDISSGQWTKIPSAPLTPQYVTSAAWAGSRLIVVGGSQDPAGKSPRDTASFDPTSSKWQRAAASPLPATGETAPVWTGHELFVSGSYHGGAGDLPSAAAYNPSSNTWRQLTPAGASSTTSPQPAAEVTIVFATWTGTQVLVLTGPYAMQRPLEGFTWTPGG
jgi:N-acetylneuraminic acid mutarotase